MPNLVTVTFSPLDGQPVIRIENPVVVAVFIGALVVVFGLYPWMRTPRFRLTPARIAALLIVLGFCVYEQSLIPLLMLLWPLSLIWFSEFWGSYRGFFHMAYIDERSPPIVVATLGWFFLVVFPLLLVWLANH